MRCVVVRDIINRPRQSSVGSMYVCIDLCGHENRTAATAAAAPLAAPPGVVGV